MIEGTIATVLESGSGVADRVEDTVFDWSLKYDQLDQLDQLLPNYICNGNELLTQKNRRRGCSLVRSSTLWLNRNPDQCTLDRTYKLLGTQKDWTLTEG